MTDKHSYTFEISLSVLDHLGRKLYRNFITVLGEAISNSWDADAENVWITVSEDNSTFIIKDDGTGMTAKEFQTQFLKIGYSKRKDGSYTTEGRNRPYIGAKGIGKLALLSCAERVSIFTKVSGSNYVGGIVDNGDLDEAIKDDINPSQYMLGTLDLSSVSKEMVDHQHGTIIRFENTKEHLRNSIPQLRKLIAMAFRFSLIDESFNIFVNGDLVSIQDLKDLSSNTEFCWVIRDFSDEFVDSFKNLTADVIPLDAPLNIRGFLATVRRPRDLKITGTGERATIDLFVNGRLREKDILRHIPAHRIPENYIYGQIHFDDMDGPGVDPFTSSREGIIEDDENFQSLLSYLKSKVSHICDKWDDLRWERGEEGDDENEKKVKKVQRKARGLYLVMKKDYEIKEDGEEKDKVDEWLKNLMPEADFNIPSYVHCFLSENLVRKYIKDQNIQLTSVAENEIKQWSDREEENKEKANISFSIRKGDESLSYLGMDFLAKCVESKSAPGKKASLILDSISYKPMRNAVAHTALLTDTAKNHLSTRFENIKARVKKLLAKKS